MGKIHTRTKRRHGLSTHTRHRYFFSNIPPKNRPKTFKSEEKAKEWAEKQGFKGYKLVNLKSEESSKKKIKVVLS